MVLGYPHLLRGGGLGGLLIGPAIVRGTRGRPGAGRSKITLVAVFSVPLIPCGAAGGIRCSTRASRWMLDEEDDRPLTGALQPGRRPRLRHASNSVQKTAHGDRIPCARTVSGSAPATGTRCPLHWHNRATPDAVPLGLATA